MWAERPTILLVEDEVIIRMMLADELRGRGFNVVEAQNARRLLFCKVGFRLASYLPMCSYPAPWTALGWLGCSVQRAQN